MRQYSLKKTFLLSTVMASIITLLTGIGLFSIIFKNTLHKTMENRFDTIQKRFTDEITQDLLIGSFAQIKLRCESYITDPTIITIKVQDDQGHVICNHKRPYTNSDELAQRSSNVYFDDAHTEAAGEVTLLYTYQVVDNIFYQSLWLLFIPFVILFFIQLFLGQTISYKLVQSIEFLSQKIKSANLKELMNLDRQKANTSIAELDLLYNKIQELAHQTYEYQQDLLSQAKQQTTVQVAKQVAHDIRSPLSALNVIMNQLGELPESKRVFLRNAIQRIDDIANELSSRTLEPQSTESTPDSIMPAQSVQLLTTLVESIISEKRIQYRPRIGLNIQLEKSKNSYGLFSLIDPLKFKRVLSNLIDNSVEAIPDKGDVVVQISKQDDKVSLLIKDTGEGIPSDILPTLMAKGKSWNKQSGNGLGLYDAKNNIEKWHGTINIQSKPAQGTAVTVILPLANPPFWFVPQISLNPDQPIYILDDDLSIHQIWTARLEALGFPDNLIQHYTDPNLLIRDIQKLRTTSAFNPKKALYLIDYEYISLTETGVQVIDTLGIAEQSILVTSRYDEPQVLSLCHKHRIKILPKPMAGFIPIDSSDQNPTELQNKKIVLIDDDALIRTTWNTYGKMAGYSMFVYSTKKEFLAAKDQFDSGTPIYIDFKLKDETGDTVSKELSELGFKNLYLATGYDDLNKNDYPWIVDIVGKMPPFKK